MSESPIEVGFGSASLWGRWKTDRELADEIDVRGLVAGGEGEWAVILAPEAEELLLRECGKLIEGLRGE